MLYSNNGYSEHCRTLLKKITTACTGKWLAAEPWPRVEESHWLMWECGRI